MIARMAAAIVALVALAGLVVQFAATLDQTGSVAGTLWTLLRYFTVLTNLLVALAFGWVAIGGRPHPRRLAGVMLAILLVGIVYGLLLRGLLTLSGGALLAGKADVNARDNVRRGARFRRVAEARHHAAPLAAPHSSSGAMADAMCSVSIQETASFWPGRHFVIVA